MDYRLLVLALGTFAIGTDAYVVAGILPEVARSFDVSTAAAGQFVTVYSLAYAILSPLMATATAHWPRRRTLLVGLIVFVVGNILTATQPTFELALISRAVAGLGAAMVTPTAGAVAAALVTPERRGAALAIVMAGLSAATALGAPIGTFVGSIGGWRSTIWLVVALGLLAAASMRLVLPIVPPSATVRLRERLELLGDVRVMATLATSALVVFGAFLIYTYLSAVFERATRGNGEYLAALLLIYGVTGTIGSLAAGRFIDRLGSRVVINIAIGGLALVFALMPWSSIHFATAAATLMVWSVCGWSFPVAQQHRLVSIAPALAPILLGLNASAMYLAIAASGAAGALAMRWLPPYDLPLISAALVICGVLGAELAHRLIRATKPQLRDSHVLSGSV